MNQFAIAVYTSNGTVVFNGTVPLGTPVPRVGEYITAPVIHNLLVTKVIYAYSNAGTDVRITVEEK